jgi:predicted secreted protein
MKWTSIAAIYLLFWVMSAFVVMPFFGRKTGDEDHPVMKGHADSAPHNFQPQQIIKWTTFVATTCFGLYYANYVNGWIGASLFGIAR